MYKINDILKQYNIKPYRYSKEGKAIMVDTNDKKYVIKENNLNREIFEYLESRSFEYYPKIINDLDNEYEISEYVDDYNLPKEQKILDMVDLVSLLHNKTTHYKEIDVADYKKIYEDITNNIEYLYNYYNEMITVIESKVFMSPSEYLLARNISKIYGALTYAKKEIDEWYEMVKDLKKTRVAVIHNNLELDHFRANKSSYLISWDKSKIDIPIFDLYKLYRRHSLDFDFEEIINRYESSYPLKDYEKKLLFILMALPDLITFGDSEYNNTKNISSKIDFMYKTESLVMPYYDSNKKGED